MGECSQHRQQQKKLAVGEGVRKAVDGADDDDDGAG
jgi:hypothetical protein